MAVNKGTFFDQRLLLVAWFSNQLGYSDNSDMLKDLKDSKEYWEDDYHPVMQILLSRGKSNISEGILRTMDMDIYSDLDKINKARKEPISLKYFQYLAMLSVEYFLHRYSDSANKLLEDLSEFSEQYSGNRYPVPETIDSLNKLALWMATGAGKTLLMHLNYHQFLRRINCLFIPDNVILLTPNETLSEQHLRELETSGIPCFKHNNDHSSLAFAGEEYPIRVLELTKLMNSNSEEVKSGGVSVSTTEFEGRNLVFVDEGHKGTGGDAWFARRDELTKEGFVFEYSATYGQAFSSSNKKDSRENEYACSIIFDYSYKHFHGDGYGKDFDVINLAGAPGDDKKDLMMLGNLLIFLQQHVYYYENREVLSRYNLESPLLLLLGARVTGGSGRTEIVDLIRFLYRTTVDVEWVKAGIKKVIQGKTGITDNRGEDIFSGRFKWLYRNYLQNQSNSQGYKQLYSDLFRYIFHAESSGALHICNITNAKGELALRVSNGEYFGLIYVGDDAIKKLVELIEKECPNIQIFEETVAEPLFKSVASPFSRINLLIGAKKFMEGWSSWRVSGMGLLHVGKQEGPLIIQLFGRGVRLKGEDMSLKRGGGENPPSDLQLLETMNIFGVQADFISNFRRMLETEGALKETISLPIKPANQTDLKGLKVPNYPSSGFDEPLILVPDTDICVVLDLSSSVDRFSSKNADLDRVDDQQQLGSPTKLSDDLLKRFDLSSLYRQLLEYRVITKKWNLVIPLENLYYILRDCCIVYLDAEIELEVSTASNLKLLQDNSLILLRKYVDKFYNLAKNNWARTSIDYADIKDFKLKNDQLSLLSDPQEYVLSIPYSGIGDKERQKIIKNLHELITDKKLLEKLWNSDVSDWNSSPPSQYPPRIYIENHLYQPLLLADELERRGISVSPVALNSGEAEFIRQLKDYIENTGLKPGEEVYLLRNQSRIGVGLHSELGSIFPDFILWIKTRNRQRIIFIDPHGMIHAPSYKKDPKVRLHETLSSINSELSKDGSVEMDSFIISQTPFKELKDRYEGGTWDENKFTENHILFPNDQDYMKHIFRRATQ